MMSPADPASSLEFKTALYSVGADGVKFNLIPGCAASKAGIICSCQMARSSFRQLSIVSVTSSATAVPAMKVVASNALISLELVIVLSLVGQFFVVS